MITQNTLVDLRPDVAHIDVACSRCDRRGRLNVARLIQDHGAGATLRDAVAALSADCPNRAAHGVTERAPRGGGSNHRAPRGPKRDQNRQTSGTMNVATSPNMISSGNPSFQ
jgi:hypothetical protein